jgi:hypothetical protein
LDLVRVLAWVPASSPSRRKDILEDKSKNRRWLRRLATIAGLLVATLVGASLLLSRADGPMFVFAGGPLVSGEQVEFADLDWEALDALHELELEIVGDASSLILWFSVHNGFPYVACDLDCIDGLLTRWPQQIERDNRVVIRIDSKRIEGQLTHILHGSDEYIAARAGRSQKYSGSEGGRAATETAAHNTVIEVGEALTGRAKRKEPGDRLFRVDPR